MGDGNKVEFLIAVCALITSAMAVFMAWDQGRVMRAQQHGAVFPVLQIDGYATNDASASAVGIKIRNSGVGPALIESVTLIDDTRSTGLETYIETLPAGYELSWSSITGRALAPGETVTPIEILWPRDSFDPDTVRRVATDAQRWRLEICYCSVFQRCWQTKEIGRSRAESVKRCERGETDIFEQLGERNLATLPPSLPAEESTIP